MNQDEADERRIGHGGYAAALKTLLDHTVPEMSASQLASQLGGDESAEQRGTQPLLLDARELGEYRVSHLEGARWVGYDDFGMDRISDLDPSTPVVVYCSVGYRSEKVAEQLVAAGFKSVYNLYGGIFEWVNQEQEVVDMEGQATERVHAYSKTWGVFLRKGKKVYKNDPEP